MGELSSVACRNFGSLQLPLVTVGTMRWADKKLDLDQVMNLISYGQSYGLNTHHVSPEYSSYPLYKNALSRLSHSERNSYNVIAKVACPDFREPDFSPDRLKERIYNLLDDLKLDRLAIAQWMDRWDKLDSEKDKLRITRLDKYHDSLLQCTDELLKDGVVGEFSSFPYTVNYADDLSSRRGINKFTCYLNSYEREYEHLIDKSDAFIAIRPFKAKELLNDQVDKKEAITNALDFVLKRGVSSAIVGINSEEQIDEIVQALNDLDLS